MELSLPMNLGIHWLSTLMLSHDTKDDHSDSLTPLFMDLVNSWLSCELNQHQNLSISSMLQELKTPLFDLGKWLSDSYKDDEVQRESINDRYYDAQTDTIEHRFYYLVDRYTYTLSSACELYFVERKTKCSKQKLIGMRVQPLWFK
jgi:hypothetical protein